MSKYSIKDLERLSGIRAHTIRIWEKRYKLLDPSRTSTNIRYYSDDDLKKILNISLLNKQGVKISHLSGLSAEDIAEKVMMTVKDISNYDAVIDHLIISIIELDEQKFNKDFSRALTQMGFEDIIIRIIFPLLDKIGILWMTGSINPAQEHFFSYLVRQKLIVAIDELIVKSHHNPQRFLLFNPEGELHEMGLLFLSYLIKKRGHEVIYFGQSVPIKDLAEAIDTIHYDYLLTSVISVYSGKELMTYLTKLAETFPQKTIYASGNQVLNLTQKLPHNIKKIDTIEDFIRFLES
ncbi:MAG: MerR family transcriptional regulator [Bacteroidales bacterium]|nr:MerR family transcriptional regulator [Bacteroidales bacterium]